MEATLCMRPLFCNEAANWPITVVDWSSIVMRIISFINHRQTVSDFHGVSTLDANSGVELKLKHISDIDGRFFIPSYQRGYRWGELEVRRLLDDMMQGAEAGDNYCLQPIVVRRAGDKFELIDGQQRLTTIFLIYSFLNKSSNGFLPKPKFSLEYETRAGSGSFLSDIDVGRREENVDYWHICEAYDAIAAWYENNGSEPSTLTKLNERFDCNISVIWYEVDPAEDPIALFTRLNIGKIPLTSSELVKAMLLSRDNSGMTRERQEEISLQWDAIENRLHDESLWAFLSNSMPREPRIDLVLDLMAEQKNANADPYATFFYFDTIRQTESPQRVWAKIQHAFLTLCDWYEDHDRFHKIGYLIACGHAMLRELYHLSEEGDKRKSEFDRELEVMIAESVAIGPDRSYGDLSYTRPADYRLLSRLLLLFNVESVRTVDGRTGRFPFDLHKSQRWSLEHIHAQESEPLRKKEQWVEWIQLHVPSVRSLEGDHSKLLEHMITAESNEHLTQSTFEGIFEEVESLLSEEGGLDSMHSIANLALLNTSANAVLNNSTFDVKRNEIIRLDREGKYIPFCTKKVFLKYYTPSERNQVHFWGATDRAAYVSAINEKLGRYLAKPIEGLEP